MRLVGDYELAKVLSTLPERELCSRCTSDHVHIKTTLDMPTYAQNVSVHSRTSTLNRYVILNMWALFQEEMIDVAIDVISCFGFRLLKSPLA